MQTFVKYHLSVHTYLDSNSLDDGKGQFIIPFHHGASTERNLIPVFGESFHNKSFFFFCWKTREDCRLHGHGL